MKKLTKFINETEKSKKQKEYQEFFDSKLKEYGVDSPAKLDDDEKKKFFDEIDKEWTQEPTNEKKIENDFDEEEDVDYKKLKEKKKKYDSKVEEDEEDEEDIYESEKVKVGNFKKPYYEADQSIEELRWAATSNNDRNLRIKIINLEKELGKIKDYLDSKYLWD